MEEAGKQASAPSGKGRQPFRLRRVWRDRQPGLSTLEVNLSALFPLLIFSPLG